VFKVKTKNFFRNSKKVLVLYSKIFSYLKETIYVKIVFIGNLLSNLNFFKISIVKSTVRER